jgi:hypothetical protein
MKNKILERYLSRKKKEYQQLRWLIHKYVEKNYKILGNKIIDNHANESIFAIDIIDEVESFFGVDYQIAFQVIQNWVFVRLPKNKWKDVYKTKYSIYSYEVQAEVRPIMATWTPEMVQDLQAFHNIDAEAELTALLSDQISQEIDRQIINNLLAINGNKFITPYRQD